MRTAAGLAVCALLLVISAWSCATDNGPVDDDYDGSDTVDNIIVSVSPVFKLNSASRAEDDENDVTGPDDDYDIVGDVVNDSIVYGNWDIDELTPYSIDFDANSIIQVSQKTRNVNPFQSDDAIFDFRFKDDADDAAWDKENTYNFSAYNTDVALDWNKIGAGGSWNGGFALFSLYFPIENTVRQKKGDNGATYYSVMADQSTEDNLKKSDILGGYHSTPKLFSRIRFRLFHLMTYLRIRLYVPLYDNEKNTGYRENALDYATLNNVTPDFIIDWNAIRSSDTQGPAVTALDGEEEIIMYQHPLPEGTENHKIMKIKYKDFLSNNYFDQGIEGDFDYVRVYDFSVIIPVQKGMVDENGQQGTFAGTDFLNFYFRTNSGAITKYYFNQALSANTTQSSLELNQGVYQYLQLYLPRVGNQAVCVSATVNPWGQMGTEMLLTPEDSDLQ